MDLMDEAIAESGAVVLIQVFICSCRSIQSPSRLRAAASFSL